MIGKPASRLATDSGRVWAEMAEPDRGALTPQKPLQQAYPQRPAEVKRWRGEGDRRSRVDRKVLLLLYNRKGYHVGKAKAWLAGRDGEIEVV